MDEKSIHIKITVKWSDKYYVDGKPTRYRTCHNGKVVVSGSAGGVGIKPMAIRKKARAAPKMIVYIIPLLLNQGPKEVIPGKSLIIRSIAFIKCVSNHICLRISMFGFFVCINHV